jgi:hypothetical protein
MIKKACEGNHTHTHTHTHEGNYYKTFIFMC